MQYRTRHAAAAAAAAAAGPSDEQLKRPLRASATSVDLASVRSPTRIARTTKPSVHSSPIPVIDDRARLRSSRIKASTSNLNLSSTRVSKPEHTASNCTAGASTRHGLKPSQSTSSIATRSRSTSAQDLSSIRTSTEAAKSNGAHQQTSSIPVATVLPQRKKVARDIPSQSRTLEPDRECLRHQWKSLLITA